MPTDFQKAMRASRKRQADPSDKLADKPEKKFKMIMPQSQPPQSTEKTSDEGKHLSQKAKSSAAEGTKTISTEETSLKVIDEGSKSFASQNRNKSNGAAISKGIVAVESEDMKIHQPEFFYKGHPLLAK